jgi:hypothetical protein
MAFHRPCRCLEDVALEANLKCSITKFNLQTREWKSWARIPMTMAVYDRVMRSMEFGKNDTEEIEDKFLNGDQPAPESPPLITLWAFYNVLTWYITHRVASLNRRVELENKLRVALGLLYSMAIRKERC